MARQLGAVRFIGRLANTVGYKARDGKGDAFDAVRNHTVEVANPQTLSQMSQRMKLTPVQNFYRGLAGLLDHSWQGVKYGNPSRLHFYSLALKALSKAGCPYVNKGNKQFIPWSFPVSEGSIAANVNIEVDDNKTRVVLPDLYAESLTNPTVANITELFSASINFHAGQQLTFLFILKQGNAFIPYYRRITLDPTDDTDVKTLGIAFALREGKVTVEPYNVAADDIYDLNIPAAAVIVSELVGNTWQRNSSSMVIAESLRSTYNSQAAFNAMLASYRTSKNAGESDWYLNGGEGDESSTVSTIKEVTEAVGGIEPTFAYYKIGATKYVPYFEQGSGIEATARSYRKESDYAFTKTGASNLGVMTAISDTTAEFAAAGYTLITRSDLLAIAPELTIPA